MDTAGYRTLKTETTSENPAPAKAVSVFVVEPLQAVRELLAEFVARQAGFRVVGASGDRNEAERECAQLRPEIAIVDWMILPDHSDSNVAEGIRAVSPATRVIVFSAMAELHFVSDAIAAGVVGFVVKNSSLETVTRAMRTVAGGKQFFCPEMAGVLRELLRHSSQAGGRASLLSHREKEVLREIAKGLGSKEIAREFGLSVFTVDNIRRRIMRKTGIKSVAALTLHAVKLGLIATPFRSAQAK